MEKTNNFSHFLWEARSQVISIFAMSNIHKNNCFQRLIECHINTIIYKQKGTTLYISSPTNQERWQEVSRHRISQFRLLVDIYSTLCILWVRVWVENYGESSIIGFMSKTTAMHVYHAFQYISLTSTERLRRETSQCDVLWKTWPYDDKFSFLYMNMDKALKNSTQGKVAYI